MSNNKVVQKAYIVCIFGKRGSGKTTLTRGQLESLPKPVVVLDILGNFNNPDYMQLTSVSETIKNVEYYAKAEDKNDLQGIFVLKPSDPNVAIDYLSATLWELWGGTLVLDECDSFDFPEAPCYDQLVRYGRNRYCNIVTGCRRPTEVPRSVTAGANKLLIFQTQEPRDVEYFEKTLIGERAQKLMNLPQFHGIYVDYDEKTIGEFRIDLDGQIYILSTDRLI